jgi:predicted lipid carrier protein YhbT
MYHVSRRPPPLTPVLLLGFALHAVPRALLDLVLADAAACAFRRYPGVFERLAGLGEARFLIDPTDLPFAFLLRLSADRPALAVAPEGTPDPPPDAVLRGPLTDLLALLEGRADGDALFFSRQLAMEGDTEKVLVLRNAIEGDDVDVAELLLERLAPLDRLLRPALGSAARAYALADGFLSLVQQSLHQPVRQELEARDAEIRRLAERVQQAEAAARRPRAA